MGGKGIDCYLLYTEMRGVGVGDSEADVPAHLLNLLTLKRVLSLLLKLDGEAEDVIGRVLALHELVPQRHSLWVIGGGTAVVHRR